MVVGSCQNDLDVCWRCCRCNNKHLKYLLYKKFYGQNKHCLYSSLSKLFSQFQKLVLKSNPVFKWLSEVVKTMYMFVGDVVAATISTKSICHKKNFTFRANTVYTMVCQNFFRNLGN